MPPKKDRLGSHCPQVLNNDGQPTLKLPANWHGLMIEETIVPGNSECGPQYAGIPILSFFLSGEVKRWYRSGLKTQILENAAPGFDIYGASYERDFGKWKGKAGTSIRLSMTPEVIQRFLPEQSTSFDLETLFAHTDMHLRQMVLLLAHEIRNGLCNGTLYAEGLSLSILGWLNKHYASKKAPPFKIHKLSERQQKRIIDYIISALDTNLTVNKIARQVGISTAHFAVLFRSTFNITPHQYVLQKRIDKAAELLMTQPEASILDVAISTGFSSQAHLTHSFKKHMKQTPARWKARNNSQT